MKQKFTGVFKKTGKWYVAWIEELPEAITQGRTLKEARANLKEALKLVIESNIELSRQDLKGKFIKEPVEILV